MTADGRLPGGLPILIEVPKEEEFGDFSTNLAMAAASRLRVPPRDVAGELLEVIGDGNGLFHLVEIAGPGFINFFIRREEWIGALAAVDDRGDTYGNSHSGAGKKVQVEFVSANPTGPLHVGHGRGAAVGDVLANLLTASGYEVEREYYINDAGRQMELLGLSVMAGYRKALGMEDEVPEDGYQGDYVAEIARDLILKKGEALLSVPRTDAVAQAADFAREWVLKSIRQDLEDFGVTFDHWVSEREVLSEHPLEELLEELEGSGLSYTDEGALWLKTSSFGDSKDRVLLRKDGRPTYFANDILYHREKYRRGFDMVIDVWGADHHGYVDRMKAAVKALGEADDAFEVILVQLVKLIRDGSVQAMSTRQGEFDTLREVMEDVGRDAARFFFVQRRADSHLDFDLDLARSQSSENPVYYVQYAHARIASIFKKIPESGLSVPRGSEAVLERLTLPEEMSLVKKVVVYPEVVAGAAESLEPHRLLFFLQDLASRFHVFYNRHRVISPDEDLSSARLYLVKLIGRILSHGLGIVGVSAPESM
jgi:arginyl-tRNA synthetase